MKISPYSEHKAYVNSAVAIHPIEVPCLYFSKTKVGYEIPINRHFYIYKPPRPLGEIEADIAALEGEIAGLLNGLVG